ncbi:MAG: methyltransferase domain-containing protein [Gemmatimonadetes bacterium]|uniref:Methyltransferase domain-containing protein n=1 Tax=Candidatus Kutchimonas denitrificans TaxID=3056748 RepID=A0AAE4Z774_9BACT|nr:methyltransferase domain-containing protein [Gemmatimonadota bacterium]NIR75024.1 methyltransferase domain-containing protein [Candidatus Kutchimonas denitrificans]NIS01607.1 methyltransferase domain-containing protein [Gemmatimonadota bacterium]NIT67345.1 methyltransferase domain-containing protein [Gemmatimonadota bacterium]NIU52708.1 methyltransferase domain-containing protein [Gemmatimonadota bacterium]
MGCRQCEGAESFFSGFWVKRELRSYQRSGPRKTTRWLIDAIKARGVEGATLLDIGGGVGAIQHELLESGAGRATGADAASAYLELVEQEAERRGHRDRMTQRHGDFVELADDLAPADIVTLDRVICCYHDFESLVDRSTAKARRLYGLVYPRYTWLTRAGNRFLNVFLWLIRNPFRVFTHPTHAVDAMIRDSGFQRIYHANTLTWQVVLYER